MPGRYSMSPEGENFQLPEPGDYTREFDRLKQDLKKQQDLGREIVVVRSKIWHGARLNG
jgi:hypothetical protein